LDGVPVLQEALLCAWGASGMVGWEQHVKIVNCWDLFLLEK